MTLIPHAQLPHMSLCEGVEIFHPSKYIHVNGVGDGGKIIGIVHDLAITIGKGTIRRTVGVCNFGSFKILLGNDVTSEFKMTINVANQRHCTYVHPKLGI